MRRLLGMLRRSDDELELAPQPSMEHVDRLVEQVREAGLPVTLDVEGDPVPLPPGVDLSAYRIVQEALTNALKHAGPGERAGDGALRPRRPGARDRRRRQRRGSATATAAATA